MNELKKPVAQPLLIHDTNVAFDHQKTRMLAI